MADSNSETCRCPCGFFGRPETGGLCSKCYREHQQKKGAEAAPDKAGATVSTEAFTKAVAQVALPTPSTVAPSSDSSSSSSSLPTASQTEESGAAALPSSSSNGTKRSRVDSQSDHSTPTSGDSKKMRDAEESQEEQKATDETEQTLLDPDKPVQKNKKRCFKCNCKLQPAIREIGRCKCDYVFCQLHRLPEQHDCVYDHKEKGRQEARDKMVSPKKHMGTSLKRIDSDS